MKHDFNDKDDFEFLENEAIDGRLDYDGFPPAEYKYFSQLARLGWLNRHRGWAKELCELKQEEHRKEYIKACAERDERLNHARVVQNRILKTTTLAHDLNFARDKDTALHIALELVENLLEEPGLAERIRCNVC